ncbi:MAG TPA: hydroxysqualene dehydroxylase HpnE [Thermohalobaculum sp.]|nr:hydroxysqualene dehydroxylase HpnE [Thermohalobaculum sp.]
MADGTVHIVGAGLAGLSAALRLTMRGRRVVLHEANRFAGGRCRTFHDARLGCAIDNGNHLVLSGNRATRAYLAATGAERRMVAHPARFAFVDLAGGERWALRMTAALPWWIASPARRAPGTQALDYLAGLRLALAGARRTVAEALPGRGPAWQRFWVPLTLAAINAPPERASARLLWAVLRETFARGERACRPLLAPDGLGSALVDPAVGWLTARGVRIELGRPLRRVEAEGARATLLRFADGDVALGAADRVVLALPPSRLRAVLPGADPPDDSSSIVNAFFRLAQPPADAPPILGVLSATSHWIFRRGDVVSVTVSAGDALGVADEPGEHLIPAIWGEVVRALGLAPGTRYLAARINKERRATFDQSPAGVAKRLGARTRLANVFLAGDATDTGLPATIEGAIRSGERAAALAG